MKTVECKDIIFGFEKLNLKGNHRRRVDLRQSTYSRSNGRNCFTQRPVLFSPKLTVKCESITQKLYRLLKSKEWTKETEISKALPKLGEQKVCEKAMEQSRKRSVQSKKDAELMSLNPINIRFLNPREREITLNTSQGKHSVGESRAGAFSRTVDNRDQVLSRTSDLPKGQSQNRFMKKCARKFLACNFASIDCSLNEHTDLQL